MGVPKVNMGMVSARKDHNAELMGDNIVGIYLSEEPLLPSRQRVSRREKLRRFIHCQEDIQDPLLHGSGMHGIVVRGKIKGREYALKVFKNWKQPGPRFYSYKDAILITPLAFESRAFARLDSGNQNGNWGIRCYGWMKLSDSQFKVIEDAIVTRGVSSHDLSRWVIVKDFDPIETNASHIPEIIENFSIPKQLKIWPQDLRPENFRGSKMVDLSCTLTYPSPGWSEFEFGFFYEYTIHGVKDWFQSPSGG